jgi:hypothetical protein
VHNTAVKDGVILLWKIVEKGIIASKDGAAVAAKDGTAAATKDGWQYAVVADKKSCCCQKWLAKALLQLLKNGFAATKEGWQWPCWLAKIVLFLLRMVLLLLLEMASNSPVAAAQKGISPALDGAITLTKIGWQMSYWCRCWKNCCCCQRWLVQAL